ncbi:MULTISPECIES: hypothetical protein [Saccharopolyspora]|uniref:Uncharacterized protein n=1 Tax=Saccharopolyspora elongata TaxID=2530387 RepID=A0A4R4XY95_9PSEU|nr:hypothetical protein [Saccharopolyspora elongata]TDD36553.1 hypothetical protein E1288_41875 [Saccharopolyspora elongata]
MSDQEFPTGDDGRARAKRQSGSYFMLPSETAEQFKRSEADMEKTRDRAVERDAHPQGKGDR